MMEGGGFGESGSASRGDASTKLHLLPFDDASNVVNKGN